MLAVLAAGLLFAPPLVCPVSGHDLPADAKMYDVNGVRFRLCCANCIPKFKEKPLSFLKPAAEKNWVVGQAVFDAVSGRKLTPQNAKGGSSDFQGVRFTFISSANKAAFDANPQKYGAIPEKWSPTCPVMNVELTNTHSATGYVDVDGVRYFSCCEMCLPKLKSAQFGKENVGAPKVFEVPAIWAKLSGPG